MTLAGLERAFCGFCVTSPTHEANQPQKSGCLSSPKTRSGLQGPGPHADTSTGREPRPSGSCRATQTPEGEAGQRPASCLSGQQHWDTGQRRRASIKEAQTLQETEWPRDPHPQEWTALLTTPSTRKLQGRGLQPRGLWARKACSL